MLCFAATSVATLYHYVFGWTAPYDLPSLPKLLGVVGGVSLLIGTAGLLAPEPARATRCTATRRKDRWTAASSPCCSSPRSPAWQLCSARGTPALAVLRALHLGAVMALFATLPYGKFAHGIFRGAALLR